MKISVAICTYNGEKFIEQQLIGILDQTRRPDEIIVCDDVSTDCSVSISEKILADSGIDFNIITNEINLGIGKNFQNAILNCTGDIIFTADQDDVWVPEKVETFLSCFKDNPDCVLAFSNGYVTDKELNKIDDLWKCVHFTKERQNLFDQGKYYDILLSKNYITGAAMAFKKNFALEFLSNPFTSLHDYWISLHAPLYGEIKMIDAPLFYYRQHGQNIKGVHSSALRNKIIRWIRNSNRCLNNAQDRFILSKEFYEENKELLQKKGFQKKIYRWVQFNLWRSSLINKKRFSAGFSVVSHILKGDYKEFYARKFSGLQDFIGCFLNSSCKKN